MILAIDAGTTGVTALVFDGNQQVVGRAYQEFPQYFPEPGHVQHDANEILAAVLATSKAACKDAKVKPANLAGIGITNQRETTVVWDKSTGEPIARALVWQDRSTAKRCRQIPAKVQKQIRRRTGLVVDAYFSASKIAALLDAHDAERKRADAGELLFGTIDTWLAWKLTGQHVTDPTNASRTMIWNIHSSEWDTDLLEYFRIPAAMLPDVVPSSHIIGSCESLGGAPLAALVGDQQAALFGQSCTEPGDAKNTYGTGCFLLQHTGATPVRSKHGLLTTRAASFDDTPQYALEGSVFMGGAAIQWLRDGLKMIATAPDVNEVAGQTESSGGVVVVPAFTGLGAPHWNPDAQGAILGMTRGTTRRHIARATLESIALQSADLIEAMAKDSGKQLTCLRVDGGATKSDLLMQMQADLLGVPVEIGATESTALGAAKLAGHAVGAWKSVDSAPVKLVPPNPLAAVESLRRRWRRALQAVDVFSS